MKAVTCGVAGEEDLLNWNDDTFTMITGECGQTLKSYNIDLLN